MAVVLLIIRTIDSDLYYASLSVAKLTTLKLLKRCLVVLEIKELRQRREGYLLEAVDYFRRAQEQAGKSSLDTIKSPLYEKYKNLVDSEQHDLERTLITGMLMES